MTTETTAALDVRLTHFLVADSGQWGRGETLKAAREAMPHGSGKNLSTRALAWRCCGRTYVDDMGGLIYREDGPKPVEVDPTTGNPSHATLAAMGVAIPPMEYKVGWLRDAGFDAKWGKLQNGTPVLYVRQHGAAKPTFWLVNKSMWARAKEVGFPQAFSEHTVLGDIFSIRA
jgi:hypothetical protein